MTDAAQEHVSVNTEIDERLFADHVRALLRAVRCGTLAGGLPYMLFTVPIAASSAGLAYLPFALCLAVLPVIVSGAATLIAALLLGLPLTVVLRRADEESRRLYALCGLLLGFIIPLATMLAVSGAWEAAVFFAVPGMLAGAAAGMSWGRWRQDISLARSLQNQDAALPKRTNPIHDLIH